MTQIDHSAHEKPCLFCGKVINELKETHVQDAVGNFLHFHCWNEIHEEIDYLRSIEDSYAGPQTLADVGMCEADFR